MNIPDRSVLLALLLAAGCTAEAGSVPPAGSVGPTAATRGAETTTTAAADERPFDRRAVQVALKAVDLHPCVAEGNEGATGHVVVTFVPDGQATSAVVDDGPTSGTASGACVAAQFRRAAVPSFTGEPVRVGRAFVLR